MLSKVLPCHERRFFFFTSVRIAIGKAFSILSDSKKREQYDQYGQAMEPQYQRTSNGGGRSSQNYYYEEDDEFSAEEIFNLFFGYSGTTLDDINLRISNSYFRVGPTTRTYRRRQQQNPFPFTTHSTQNHPQNVRRTSACIFPSLISFSFRPLIHLHNCCPIYFYSSSRSSVPFSSVNLNFNCIVLGTVLSSDALR